MKNLLLEQRGPQGSLKTWRIRAQGQAMTFGSSKHADLRSPDSSVRGMQGYFQFQNGEWTYFSLNLSHDNLNESIEISLSKATELKMGSTILSVKPFDDRESLISSFDQIPFEKSAENQFPYQLFTVTQGQTLLETQLIQIGEDFTSPFDATQTKLRAQNTAQWMKADIGLLQISQRTVYLTSDKDIRKFDRHSVIGRDEKIPLIATLLGAGILAMLFLISPNAQNAGEVALSTLPPAEYRQMKLAPVKKQKVVATQKAMAPTAEASAAPASKAQASALSSIRSLGGASRLSQLLGKISAAGARSSHVVVTNGIAAGTAPSGRALAALGSNDQSGKDWGSEGKGTNVNVATVGAAGGKGTGGMGNLAAGKTGTGGAELLEDESEIVGGLDRDVIAGVIRSQLGQILYCYERQLSASPDLYGKVAVRFTIDAKGEVETQRIGDSTLRNATVEGCILQKVARWKFPAPEGGTKVVVTYPFLFKSTN